MVVDTSVLIAILFDEPEKSAFAGMIDTAVDPKMSAVTRVEAMMVYLGRRRNEPSDVLDLIEILGLEQSNVSQHLSILRGKNVVFSRKAGNQVFYTLRDPVLIEVLELLRTYFYTHIQHSADALAEIREEGTARRA